MLSLPATVDEAYNAVNPEKPLELGDLDPRYVDCSEARSGEDEAAIIARRIIRSRPPDYSKQLFTGHRGCGKSTELFRLKRMLEEQGFVVVYFDAEAELDISDLDYPDVLLTIAQQVEKNMREAAGIGLNRELVENVARWFGTTVVSETKGRDINTTLETEYGLGVNLPYVVFAKMLAAFKGEIKSSNQRRTEIRQELERRATELIQRVNELIDDAQVRLARAGKRNLVLIIDGLEKLIYRIDPKTNRSTHDLLFIDHGEQLRSPNCHLVYTIPINLIFNRHVGQTYAECTILPMIKVSEEHGDPCPDGMQALRKIIATRLDVPAVFDSAALVDELVKMSGGHVRDLLRLVRYVFDYAESRVNSGHVELGIRKLVNEYDFLIKDGDLPLLQQVHHTKRVPNDEAHALLLYNLLVLEYRNGERWADVHPAVQAARKFREAKPARGKRKK